MSGELSELEELRIGLARQRGFIAEDEESAARIQLGLEEMHDAPLSVLGKYAIVSSEPLFDQVS